MIFRVEKTKGYTVMSNFHLRDSRLTLKAVGLLSIMLSMPSDWSFSVRGISSKRKESKDTIMRVIQELESFGYIKREQFFDEKRRFKEISYIVYESPYSPCPKNADTEKPYPENPCPKNEDNNKLLNEVITKQINTNKITTTAFACEEEGVENFDENTLRQLILFLNGQAKTTALMSYNQVASLNERLTYDECEYYLNKLRDMKMKEYKFSCSDYEFILKMVEADRAVGKVVS